MNNRPFFYDMSKAARSAGITIDVVFRTPNLTQYGCNVVCVTFGSANGVQVMGYGDEKIADNYLGWRLSPGFKYFRFDGGEKIVKNAKAHPMIMWSDQEYWLEGVFPYMTSAWKLLKKNRPDIVSLLEVAG